MDRRYALRLFASLAAGAAFLPASAEKVLAYPRHFWQRQAPGVLPEQTALFAALCETILPPTADSPGAREAGVQFVFPVLLTDCTTTVAVDTFNAGLEGLEQDSRKQFQAEFTELDLPQRTQLLREAALDASQLPPASLHFFRIAKNLTLIGFFTSEVGITRALQYLPVPGVFDADVPLESGQKAWYR
ncbi:MAG: gluconate 2-dehydrogenase subunit 3 family protein [Bacteroidetes bacterium]|nr:MAG: gluconate 2-dehydrogenase subunit 3 family protein [Bacteroidota bacterium]